MDAPSSIFPPTHQTTECQWRCFKTNYAIVLEDMIDTDLSGIGVTSSFLITALVTFILVLHGSLRNLIVDGFHSHNKKERAFTHTLAHKKTSARTSRLVKLMLGTADALPRLAAEQARQMKEFHAVIQSLGDQQLVLSLAYMIAGLVDPCTLSFYSLRNLVALVWLSVVVQLSTLAVTSRDTRSRGKGFAANLPHLLRLFFMAMVFILFIFLNGVYLLAAHRQRYDDRIAALFLLSNTDPRVPATVQPVVQVAASALAARQIQSTTDSNGNTTRPLTIEDVKNSKSLAGWIITIHLGTIYFSRILVLASKEINDYTNAGWKRRDALSSMLFRKLARFVNRNHLQVGTSPSPATYSNSLVEASSPEFRYDLYKELAAQHDISPEISWFFRNTHTGREIKTTFSNCFVNDLLWLVFVLFQAVTRVILCWTSFRHLKKTDAAGGGAAMKWGIGQIMPMIMVLLPILSWIAITVNTTTTTATTATTSSTSSSSASSISIVAATGTGSLALPTRSAAVQSSSTSGSSSMPVPVGTDDGSSNPAAADSLNNTTLSEHHRTPNSTRDTNMRMPPFVSPQAVHDIELRTWVLSHNIIFPFYISLKVICLFTIFSSVLLVIFQILVDDQLSILGPPNAQATLKHEYGITGIIYGSTVFLLILGPLRVIWSFLLQTYTDFQYLRRKRDKRPKRPKPLRSEAERSRQRCEQVKNLGLIVAELRDSVGARAQRDLDATRERLTEGKAALEQLEAEMRASESVLADLSRLEFRPELEFFVDVLSGWDVVLERYDKEVAEGRDRGGLEEETFRCDTGGRGLFGSRFG